MTEYIQQIKPDEQYPLLKVEGGGGDGNLVQGSFPQNMTVGWNVSCTPKQSWCKRWPEYVSACWMTIILLSISFLVFYALGMSAYRRQPVVIVRCNNSNPASDVFYHHILSQDIVPFSLFSDYLSFMAREYSALRFHVYFLIDDTWQRQPKSLKMLPHITVFKQSHRREIRDFQRKFQNVNISVMYLSKYMGMTPLRYKWKIIPQNYLTFYARIYEIWQNGGVGFDLVTFNNQFNNNQEQDRRVDAILKQHNNGIEPEKYVNVISCIDNEDQNELFSMFFNLINIVLNETSSFFNTGFTTDIKIMDNPVITSHRNKRDVFNNSNTNNDTLINNTTNISNNTKGIEVFNVINKNVSGNISSLNSTTNLKNKDDFIKTPSTYEVHKDMPQLLLFYDINRFPDETRLNNRLPKAIGPSELLVNSVHGKPKTKYLLLSPEGYFVAASTRHHPFLAQLFSSSCHRLDPKYAIKDTLLSQCSGYFRDDVYCENIHVIYNII